MAADFRIRPLADRIVVKPVEREAQTKISRFHHNSFLAWSCS
jgi:hypothetical protein